MSESNVEQPSAQQASTGAMPRAIVQRNITLKAINQFFVETGMTLSQPSMVLTLFVKALGGSNLLVGLVPSIRFFGWLAPQFLAAGSMQRFTRFMPVVTVLEIIRAAFYIIMAVLTYFYGVDHPELVLAAFFVLFTITRVTAGSSAVGRTEIIARMVPPEERARVVAICNLAGGVAGFLAGLAVRAILDGRVSQFPMNYTALIGLSGLSFAISIPVLNGIKEQILPIKPRRIDMWQQIRRAPSLLRQDRRYALYVGVRAASTGVELATPFYILYATGVLGAPPAMAGIYVALQTFARVLSNPFWGMQCTKRGDLWVMRSGIACHLIAAVGVLLLPRLLILISGEAVPSWAASLFGLVFLVEGLGASAGSIGNISYLYSIAPERDRPTYYGLANTLLGPLYFLPALSGALLDLVGYAPIFAVAASSLALAFGLASRLSAHRDTCQACSTPGVSTE